MKSSPLFRASSVTAVMISLLAWQPASAGTYKDSEDHSKFVQELTQDSGGSLFMSLMAQFGIILFNCGTASGVTAGAAVIDSVPIFGLVRNATALSGQGARLAKKIGASLKIDELPYLVAAMEAMLPLGQRLVTMTPEALKAFLTTKLPILTKPMARHTGYSLAYGQRIIGAILGYHAHSPQNLAQVVDTIGPHLMGGAVSALVDYGLFKVMSKGLNLNRDEMPEGQLTREAYRSTRILAKEGFSENSACGVAKTKFGAAMDEVLMRSNMAPRPGQNGVLPTGLAITSNRVKPSHPDALRPFGGADNGGPDFAPRGSASRPQ